MVGIVTCALMLWSAVVRVGFGDLQTVFIDGGAVNVMQASIVEIIDMSVVDDGGVSASLAMGVGMIVMYVSHNFEFPFLYICTCVQVYCREGLLSPAS